MEETFVFVAHVVAVSITKSVVHGGRCTNGILNERAFEEGNVNEGRIVAREECTIAGRAWSG